MTPPASSHAAATVCASHLGCSVRNGTERIKHCRKSAAQPPFVPTGPGAARCPLSSYRYPSGLRKESLTYRSKGEDRHALLAAVLVIAEEMMPLLDGPDPERIVMTMLQ